MREVEEVEERGEKKRSSYKITEVRGEQRKWLKEIA